MLKEYSFNTTSYNELRCAKDVKMGVFMVLKMICAFAAMAVL
jgi:hypothetical protein